MPNQFRCNNGQCIASNWRCDWTQDCMEGEDEICDDPTCAKDEIRCSNGKFLKSQWLCDGEDECGDGNDEQNCRKHLQLYSNICRSEIKNGIVSNKQVVVNAGLDSPEGIAVDWIHHHLYWTNTGRNTGLNTIQVSNLEGDKKATIIDNDLDLPRGIALDPKMDYIDSRIFWIDAKLHTIMSADLDGSRIRTVLHNNAQISHPFSMAVFEDEVFWTEWSGDNILTAHKYTGKNFQRKVQGLNKPMDMDTDYTSTVVTTMTIPERTVNGDNNILTTQSSAESQPTSMKTLRPDERSGDFEFM
ncbi:low-density lipoprotein receptor-related protein 8-like [Mytilus californianus]|uniref:low-density lipoprotein receptor-related protein 8-like n=1 Tax=Mytilus californianus TaxID=6549 RepID=UPI0022467A06|nr:low-density lipoprotein receptor-related protein 8-like [Mytilus californianus]